jgi:hypothetical protein
LMGKYFERALQHVFGCRIRIRDAALGVQYQNSRREQIKAIQGCSGGFHVLMYREQSSRSKWLTIALSMTRTPKK